LAYLNGSASGTSDYIFSGSRDGTLKRWELNNRDASFSATFESHVDWVCSSLPFLFNLIGAYEFCTPPPSVGNL
jgi:WD40 repeat protein